MTPEAYKTWIKSRGPAGAWTHAECLAADALIRRTAVDNFAQWAEINVSDAKLRHFVVAVVSANFGTVEVDNLLVHLKMYPEWM